MQPLKYITFLCIKYNLYKQEVAMHAPIPHGVCRPVAEHQQTLPHLSRRYRNSSQQGCYLLNTVGFIYLYL